MQSETHTTHITRQMKEKNNSKRTTHRIGEEFFFLFLISFLSFLFCFSVSSVFCVLLVDLTDGTEPLYHLQLPLHQPVSSPLHAYALTMSNELERVRPFSRSLFFAVRVCVFVVSVAVSMHRMSC